MNLEKSFQNLPKLGGLVVTHPSGFLPPAENLHFGDGLSKADRSAFAFFQAWGPRHQNPRIPPYERDNLIWGVPWLNTKPTTGNNNQPLADCVFEVEWYVISR